jgi:transcriptional repressor NrdR
MNCPFCNSPESKVVDKRDAAGKNATRRRRECLSCFKRFTTYEYIEESPLIVIKKDGTRQSFDRQKIQNGLIKACEKRPISLEKIEETTSAIEAKFRAIGEEIPSQKIGDEIMKALKKLDKVAYIRFASVYREFEDINEFKKELKGL